MKYDESPLLGSQQMASTATITALTDSNNAANNAQNTAGNTSTTNNSPTFVVNNKTSKRIRNGDIIPSTEVKGEILFRGKAPFSNSVSKSFMDGALSSMTVHMPYFRILRSLKVSPHHTV